MYELVLSFDCRDQLQYLTNTSGNQITSVGRPAFYRSETEGHDSANKLPSVNSGDIKDDIIDIRGIITHDRVNEIVFGKNSCVSQTTQIPLAKLQTSGLS